MKTLTDFKKYLATPNAKIRLVASYDGWPINPALSGWRTVAKLQTNAVAFTTENKSGLSWLYFPASTKFSVFSDGLINVDGLIYQLGENIICPNHEGQFDCSPFCILCEGEQEFNGNELLPCSDCRKVFISKSVYAEELGLCVECSNNYFGGNK